MRTFSSTLAMALLLVIACAHMACAATPSLDYSKYSIRDGALFLGDTPVTKPDSEDPNATNPDVVDPAPHTVDSKKMKPEAIASGAVYYWSVITMKDEDQEDSDTWTALFFSKAGKFIFALPLEYGGDCQEVIPSPDGQKMLIGGGSFMRPEMTYSLYNLGDTTPKATFNGMRGVCIEWVDILRFVISTLNENNTKKRADTAISMPLSLAFSVVLYDTTNSQETVIKAATDTQNFFLESVDLAKNIAKITESWVKKASDWNDEDKVKERTIEVEIPAAG